MKGETEKTPSEEIKILSQEAEDSLKALGKIKRQKKIKNFLSVIL